MAAMQAYQSYAEIKDQEKNKNDLASLESAIEQENLEMQKTNKSMLQRKADLNQDNEEREIEDEKEDQAFEAENNK